VNQSNEVLPSELIGFLALVIKRADVQSVSFPSTDERLWRLLVDEQILRARCTGLHLQHAFGLSGPDSGLPFDAADWGGYVHIPYEGLAEADLIVRPKWRALNLNAAMGDGPLSGAIGGKPCHHLLVKGLHQQVDSASRTQVAGWTFYTSKRPYEPCNPFMDRKFPADGTLPSTRRARWDC
jgi:hypothetical protein